MSLVSIGTTTTLKDEKSGAGEKYTLLGAWDGDPDKHILSYLTTIGQALLGHRVGETINLPDETGQNARPGTIASIAAYTGAQAATAA